MQRKTKVLTSAMAFLLLFPLLLAGWLYITPMYGNVLNRIGGHLAGKVMGLELIKLEKDQAKTLLTFQGRFFRDGRFHTVRLGLRSSPGSHTYNTPITLALILCLWPLIKWSKLSVFEGLAFIFLLHLLFVFVFTSYGLYVGLVRKGILASSKLTFDGFMYLRYFMESCVIRYEAFLVVLYLLVRNWSKIPRLKRTQPS